MKQSQDNSSQRGERHSAPAATQSQVVYSEYACDRLLEKLERQGSQLRCVVRYSSNHILVKWQ